MNSKHAYDMLIQDLNSQIAQASRDEKSVCKAQILQDKAGVESATALVQDDKFSSLMQPPILRSCY